jgi:hypothetical protein
MAMPPDPSVVPSSYQIAKDFLPAALTAAAALVVSFIALVSAQIAVWAQNNAAKKSAEERLAAERLNEHRLARRKQMAFLIMFYQEIGSLKVMVPDRLLKLDYFKRKASTAEKQVLDLNDDHVNRARLDSHIILNDLSTVIRNDWKELALFEPSLQITYHEIYIGLHMAANSAQKVRAALEKSGIVIASEIEDIISLLNHVFSLVNDILPRLDESLQSQIKAGSRDYDRPAVPD